MKTLTEGQELAICNLVSNGVSVAEAKKRILTPSKTVVEPGDDDGKLKKLSANEKKAALVPEFEALGAETPAEGESFAKWEQALTAAKEAAKTEPEAAEGETADMM